MLYYNFHKNHQLVIIQDIRKVIKILHDNNYVHGDICFPDILVTNNPLRAYT